MRTLLVFTIVMLGGFAALWPVPAHAGALFYGVSYAPSNNTSASANMEFSEERIRQDLTTLSSITGRVRTYTVGNGLDRVPTIASEFNMKVSLGIWLGPNRGANETQLTKALSVILANTDTIDRVFVGNETLLRGDITLPELQAYLRRVKQALAATSIEVTTGETWGYWLNTRELGQDCDVVAAHILPYWDGYPVSDAGDDIDTQLAALRAAFPGKKIVIAETGWPSQGQTRVGAIPSPSNQQRFYSDFLRSHAAAHFDYYVVEAFDQPWKVQWEGEVGANWGIFDIHGAPKLDLPGLTKSPQPTAATPHS